MDWPEVERRIAGGEDARTEFQQGLGDLSGVGRALCAFVNSDGGSIVFGVGDAGEIVGVPDDPHAVRERLTSFLRSGCSEPVLAHYGRHRHGGKWVHWLRVPPVFGTRAETARADAFSDHSTVAVKASDGPPSRHDSPLSAEPEIPGARHAFACAILPLRSPGGDRSPKAPNS